MIGLIIGINGITGSHLVRHMLKDQRFTKIYGVDLEETCPTYHPKDNRLQYLSCDISNENNCTRILGNLTDVTHLVYCAWRKGVSQQEDVDLNGRMFKNILNIAIKSFKSLEHVVLQTGLNYFGTMIGKNKVPIREEDPRVEQQHFYYVQEDYLKERGTNVNWTYNIVRPHSIIGFGGVYNQMNLAQSIAVYALLCKEKNLTFTFPGTQKAFDAKFDFTDANLLCEFYLFLFSHRTENKVKNNSFNIVNRDGQFIQWRTLWPKIADYFGVKTSTTPTPRKLEQEMKKLTQDWTNIVQKYGLVRLDLDQIGTWSYLDTELSREWDCYASLKKVRDIGFTKDVDYLQSFIDCFAVLQKEKYIFLGEGVQRGKVQQQGLTEQKQAQSVE